MNNKKAKILKILVTLAVAVGGIGYVAAQSLKDVTYYKMVYEVTPDPGPWMEKAQIKLHGYVKPGTIKTRVENQQTHRSFVLENKGEEVVVVHAGVVPDTFKDQAEVVAVGKLVRENGQLVLQAISGDGGISAKCPSRYNE
jgi:cytochrome c-type biogenesis protein CcmE